MQASDYVKTTIKNTKLLEMDIRPGDMVRVHERVTEGSKERVAVYEGLVISRRHGTEPGASITVRRITKGIGVERVFPLAMPTLEKIEIIRRAKVRRAKLNYLRNLIGKRAMLRGELLPPGFGQPTEQEEEAAKAKVETEDGKEEVISEDEGADTKDAVDEPKKEEKNEEVDTSKEDKE